MDISRIQKLKKKRLEHTSGKSARGKATYATKRGNSVTKNEKIETFEVDGIHYPLPPDYYELEEFDLDDPENIKMMKEEEEANIRKYGRLTSKELDEICIIKEDIISKNPGIKRKKAFDLAWEKFTGKKLPNEENN